MNFIIIMGLVAAGIVAVAIAACFIVCGDLMSYTATGSKVLSPVGAPTGRALVVYNPGISGDAGNADCSEFVSAVLQ